MSADFVAPVDLRRVLGQELREARRAAGCTQGQLARDIGYSRSTVSSGGEYYYFYCRGRQQGLCDLPFIPPPGGPGSSGRRHDIKLFAGFAGGSLSRGLAGVNVA
jgi:hypothetical protein